MTSCRLTLAANLHRLAARIASNKATPYDRGLFFLHLGKCGGTSVTTGLNNSVSKGNEGYVDMPHMQRVLPLVLRSLSYDQVYSHLMASVSLRTIDAMHAGRPFVFGHIPCTVEAFLPYRDSYWYATILREPESRLVSSYRYSCRLTSGETSMSRDGLIERFVNYLKSPQGSLDANTFCYYFSGMIGDFNFASKKEAAIKNLNSFDALGFLDQLEQFADQIVSLGFRRPVFQHLNKTSVKYPDDSDPLPKELCETAEIKEMVRVATALDREIYDQFRHI